MFYISHPQVQGTMTPEDLRAYMDHLMKESNRRAAANKDRLDFLRLIKPRYRVKAGREVVR